MSHPAGLPDLFLDRSLGRIKVPQLLRAAGLRLVTLAEHYGVPGDESVEDVEWLELAGSRGWAVFMKDTRVRYNPAEREVIRKHRVRCFCLSSQSLTAEQMAGRFSNTSGRSSRHAAKPARSSTRCSSIALNGSSSDWRRAGGDFLIGFHQP